MTAQQLERRCGISRSTTDPGGGRQHLGQKQPRPACAFGIQQPRCPDNKVTVIQRRGIRIGAVNEKLQLG